MLPWDIIRGLILNEFCFAGVAFDANLKIQN